MKTVTLEPEDISGSLIRDRIVVGVTNQATKTRLLREHNLTLETAVNLVRAQEMADKRVQALLTANATSINNIGRKRPRPASKPQYNKRYKTQNSQCGFCGNQHQLGRPDMCPAYRQKCSKCGLKKSSASMRQKLKTETANDPCLAKITYYILNDWPEHAKLCDPNVIPYWSLRNELSSYDGLVLYEDKIVIPKILQSDILSKLHDTHQGRVRCKALARRGVYWRNINADKDNMVDKCEECLNTRKLPCKVELKSHEVPSRPFEKVGADIVTVFGKKYQVVVDYFSKWIEVRELSRNPTSDQLISHFKSIFSRFGIPDIAFSDREPIYALASMRKFCEQYDIKKDFSSARYSQSNGQVERAIGHVKNIIKRCSGKIDDINMCLLDYRATPLTPSIGSPHNILLGRDVRTNLPCLPESLINENDRNNRNNR